MWKHLPVSNHDKDYHDANQASNEHSAMDQESLSHLSMNNLIKNIELSIVALLPSLPHIIRIDSNLCTKLTCSCFCCCLLIVICFVVLHVL